MSLHVDDLRNLATHSAPQTSAGTPFRFGSMFDGLPYLFRRLVRFLVAAFAVTSSIMLVVWNLDLNAPVDQRSAMEKTRDEVTQFRLASGGGSAASPLGSLLDQVSRIASAFTNAMNRMRDKDRGALESQDRDLKGLFAGLAQPRGAPVALSTSSIAAAPSPRAGLSSKDRTVLQNHSDGAGVDFSAASRLLPNIGGGKPGAASAPGLLSLATPQAATPAPAPSAQSSGFASMAPVGAPAIANFPTPTHLAMPDAPVQRPSAPVGRPSIERNNDKPSPLTLERGEANAVITALNAAAEDFRTFPQAAAYFASFAERYPNSTQRRTLQQRFDVMSQTRDKAVEERRALTPDSKLSAVDFDEVDSDARDDCLSDLGEVKAAAIVQKAVTVQANLPAYFILADVDWPKAKTQTASTKPQSPDGERSAMVEKINACFDRQAADGTVTVMFWSDAGSKAVGPLFAKVPDALVYTRD